MDNSQFTKALSMDELTIKTPNPVCRLFFKTDLLSEFAALCLTGFIDWRYIYSLVGKIGKMTIKKVYSAFGN
jgi:hypothetical protein